MILCILTFGMEQYIVTNSYYLYLFLIEVKQYFTHAVIQRFMLCGKAIKRHIR